MIDMTTVRGSVLWYERAPSKFNPADLCYFLAVAVQKEDLSVDLFGNTLATYEKIILKGQDAKRCLEEAQRLGLDLHGNIYDQNKYKPNTPHLFEFYTLSPPVKDGKNGVKYLSAERWCFLKKRGH